MERVTVKYSGNYPTYQTTHAAGADIKAFLKEDIVIKPLSRTIVPTGIYLEIPEGFEAQIRPRSGLAANYGITILNSPGTIDSDYRGEIKVIIINLSNNDFIIKNGDRIAQMVIAPVLQADFIQTDNLDETERGAGGFGSTGI
ncbi:MAG: dUTP diphosphatase [Spirochaetales bacterium]|nr:dUTP diphosphatase [Spirochaetales bacterium]